MALIVLCALPVFASTPEQDMVLIVDEGDGNGLSIQEISENELSKICGNIILDPITNELPPAIIIVPGGHIVCTYNSNTGEWNPPYVPPSDEW